jgi:hypothetical protein
VSNGVRLVERMHELTGQPLPEHFYSSTGG